MTRTSITSLRIFNICGGTVSTIYAVAIHSWPIVVMNLVLISINLFQVIRSRKSKTKFTCLKTDTEDQCVKHFLETNREDIKKRFPEFSEQNCQNCDAYVVLERNEMVGILIGKRQEDALVVNLDYTTPKYRNLSVATFLFE